MIFIPVPFLASLFALPAAAWLALVRLTVPVLLLERLPFREGLARGIDLALRLLEGDFAEGDTVSVDARDGELVFERVVPAEAAA